jgi:chromate transporter
LDADQHSGPERSHVPALTVFAVFLRLGLTSFGGPVAHLSYFHREIVERRKWLSEAAYAELVALCQFLPGPASSQTGFAVGLRMAGPLGGLAAFLGFTLPSAALMLAAAFGLSFLGPYGAAITHGLKLVAVPIVADAVMTMARSNCRSIATAALAVGALGILLALPTPLTAPAVILIASISGFLAHRRAVTDSSAPQRSHSVSVVLLAVFLGLLFGLPGLRQVTADPGIATADAFYRSGALVFGGGHVVLPLLQSETATTVSSGDFLTGYGFAQALPGPLFSFAAYLGALTGPNAPNMLQGLIALVAIFLPGLLLVAAVEPVWRSLSHSARARDVVAHAGAAVVGVLAAAWWSPVTTGAVVSIFDAVIATVGTVALISRKVSVVTVVWLVALAGAAVTGL